MTKFHNNGKKLCYLCIQITHRYINEDLLSKIISLDHKSKDHLLSDFLYKNKNQLNHKILQLSNYKKNMLRMNDL
jgi:hypothetical protein